jgi:hypothetical protein
MKLPDDARAIPGASGYFVSSSGEVYSTRRCRAGARRLSLYKDQFGYLNTKLQGNAVACKSHGVHRLVALAFHGEPSSPEMEARHLNGDPSDNRPGNIAWGTQGDNAADRTAHGRTVRGARHRLAKLDEENVRLIRAAQGTRAQIAAQFGVSQSTVKRIRARTLWGWLP